MSLSVEPAPTATPAADIGPDAGLTRAVIIEGARRGDVISVAANAPTAEYLTKSEPEAEALMDAFIKGANEIAETLREMRGETQQWREEMQERKKERDDVIRAIERSNQVAI